MNISFVCIIRNGKRRSADLSFNVTTATCSVYVRPEKASDTVEVSVQLLCGNTIVAEWDGMTGTGVFSFEETASVKKRKTYTMKTTCSINGKTYPIADVTKKCK